MAHYTIYDETAKLFKELHPDLTEQEAVEKGMYALLNNRSTLTSGLCISTGRDILHKCWVVSEYFPDKDNRQIFFQDSVIDILADGLESNEGKVVLTHVRQFDEHGVPVPYDPSTIADALAEAIGERIIVEVDHDQFNFEAIITAAPASVIDAGNWDMSDVVRVY